MSPLATYSFILTVDPVFLLLFFELNTLYSILNCFFLLSERFTLCVFRYQSFLVGSKKNVQGGDGGAVSNMKVTMDRAQVHQGSVGC